MWLCTIKVFMVGSFILIYEFWYCQRSSLFYQWLIHYIGDLNETYFVGNVDEESQRLVRCTYECLEKAISIGMCWICQLSDLWTVWDLSDDWVYSAVLVGDPSTDGTNESTLQWPVLVSFSYFGGTVQTHDVIKSLFMNVTLGIATFKLF